MEEKFLVKDPKRGITVEFLATDESLRIIIPVISTKADTLKAYTPEEAAEFLLEIYMKKNIKIVTDIIRQFLLELLNSA